MIYILCRPFFKLKNKNLAAKQEITQVGFDDSINYNSVNFGILYKTFMTISSSFSYLVFSETVTFGFVTIKTLF